MGLREGDPVLLGSVYGCRISANFVDWITYGSYFQLGVPISRSGVFSAAFEDVQTSTTWRRSEMESRPLLHIFSFLSLVYSRCIGVFLWSTHGPILNSHALLRDKYRPTSQNALNMKTA